MTLKCLLTLKYLALRFNGTVKESVSILMDINSFRREWEIVGFIYDDPTTLHDKFGNCNVIEGRDLGRVRHQFDKRCNNGVKVPVIACAGAGMWAILIAVRRRFVHQP